MSGAHEAAGTSRAWQLATDSALRYQDVLVPTILGPAAQALVDVAAPAAGTRVLDVGCGTGAATRPAADRAAHVTGVDVNAGMLACAREHLQGLPHPVELREGSALDLPFDDGSFDVVLCAQTLQFLPDPPAAVAEMRRVLRAGGRICVSTWAPLERNPYFQALVDAMAEHVGADVAAGLGSAFALDDEHALRALLGAGGREVDVRVVRLELDLPLPADFVPRHVTATPMAAGFAAATSSARQAVVDDVTARMEPYASSGGMSVPFHTFVAVAR